MEIRDQAAIVGIYNHYIETNHCTFDTRPFTVEERAPWFDQFNGDMYVCLVAEHEDRIAGYACSFRFKEKPAYRTSVEISVYVDHDTRQKGIGSTLYEHLFRRLASQPLHRAYAGITLPNDASIELHTRFGFEKVGQYREVGYKFDRYWDVAWYEKDL